MIQVLALYVLMSGPAEWLVGKNLLPAEMVLIWYFPIGVLVDLDLCPAWLASWLLFWTP